MLNKYMYIITNQAEGGLNVLQTSILLLFIDLLGSEPNPYRDSVARTWFG